MLLNRLLRLENPKIAAHHFVALTMELWRGAITKAQMVSLLQLDQTGANELDVFINKILAKPTAIEKYQFIEAVHDLLTLAEGGFLYTTRASFLARIQEL